MPNVRTADAERLEYWSELLSNTCEQSVDSRQNEDALIADIDPVIRAALVDLYGMDDRSFHVELNTVEGHGYQPVDRVYGSVVVEYEWRMGAARKRHGAVQALRYISNLRGGNDVGFTAVVSDGREWGFLIDSPSDTPSLFADIDRSAETYFEWRSNSHASCRRFLRLCGSHMESPVTGRALAEAFGPNSQEVEWFVGLLAALLSGRSSGDRTDTLFVEWSRSTEVVYGALNTLPDVMAQQLRDEFNIPHGSCESLAEVLFVAHTYFALVARLVAIEVLAVARQDLESEPSSWPSLNDEQLSEMIRKFDAGLLPTGLEVDNLFEADVFSWWVDRTDSEILNAFRGILEILAGFAFPRVAFGAAPATDNLRELYQKLIPREMRKQLGEFPTPFWLAEASLARLEELGADLQNGRILDPCCGTGAFLLPILRRRVSQLRLAKGDKVSSNDVQAMFDGIAGFDINPIAVTATRANFVVALGSLAEVGRFSLPVWRTDSIVVPHLNSSVRSMSDERLLGLDLFELKTSLPAPFPIPLAFKTSAHISNTRRALESAIELESQSEGLAEFISDIKVKYGPESNEPCTKSEVGWEEISRILEVLYERVRILRDQDRDGIWPRVIENSFAPVLNGRFDVVVGNPPWLGWPKLPERWRSEAEMLWKQYGLWDVPLTEGERRKRFAQFNDIATLVFAIALGRYAKEGAWVGFLVPEALTKADPGARAFRKFRLTSTSDFTEGDRVDIPFRISYCDIWSQIKPFGSDAANSPVFLAAQRDLEQTFPVPTSRWERRVPGAQLSLSWGLVRHELRAVDGESHPINRQAPFSAWSFSGAGIDLLQGGSNSWRFGMGVNTRGANGVFYVELLEAAKADGLVKLRNMPNEGRDRNLGTHTSRIESQLVYPLLRGRDIKPWVAAPSGYVVITQDPDSFERMLSERSLSSRYPRLLTWLRKHRAKLISRSAPNAGWSIAGKDWYRLEGPFDHLRSGYFVVVPEQQLPPPAAVVSAEVTDPLLRRRALPMPNHKVLFCAVSTLDEALYVTSMINSAQMQELLVSFGVSTSISPTTLARLPIPPFQLENPLVAEIVRVGRSIYESSDRLSEYESQVQITSRLVESLLLESGASPSAAVARQQFRVRTRPQPTPIDSLPLFEI